jgi:hypothetical protein
LLSNFGAEVWLRLGIFDTGGAISGMTDGDLSCDLLNSLGFQVAGTRQNDFGISVDSEVKDSSSSDSSEDDMTDDGFGYVWLGYGRSPKGLEV